MLRVQIGWLLEHNCVPRLFADDDKAGHIEACIVFNNVRTIKMILTYYLHKITHITQFVKGFWTAKTFSGGKFQEIASTDCW